MLASVLRISAECAILPGLVRKGILTNEKNSVIRCSRRQKHDGASTTRNRYRRNTCTLFAKRACGSLSLPLPRLLTEQRIVCGSVKAWGTPRRLALIIRDVARVQADKQSKNKGPSVKIAFDADGKPTKAAAGFARGQKHFAQNNYLLKKAMFYAVIEEKGAPVAELPASVTG